MKVLYVDFGNKEIIPVTSLRVLISDFRAQPIQAFECCLDGIQPIDQVSQTRTRVDVSFDKTEFYECFLSSLCPAQTANPLNNRCDEEVFA